VETVVIKRGDGEDAQEDWRHHGQKDFVPSLRPFVEMTASDEQLRVGAPQIADNDGLHEEENGDKEPALEPRQRTSGEKQEHVAEDGKAEQNPDESSAIELMLRMTLLVHIDPLTPRFSFNSRSRYDPGKPHANQGISHLLRTTLLGSGGA
jgi:hypothetical protein